MTTIQVYDHLRGLERGEIGGLEERERKRGPSSSGTVAHERRTVYTVAHVRTTCTVARGARRGPLQRAPLIRENSAITTDLPVSKAWARAGTRAAKAGTTTH